MTDRTPEEISALLAELARMTPEELAQRRTEILERADLNHEQSLHLARLKHVYDVANATANPADPFLYGVDDRVSGPFVRGIWDINQSMIMSKAPNCDREELRDIFATVFAMAFDLGARNQKEIDEGR